MTGLKHHKEPHGGPGAVDPPDNGPAVGGEAGTEMSEGVPGRDIETLKIKLEEKEKEAKEHYDRYLRMAADFDNYRKRTAREREEWAKTANEDLLKAILPFVDNLERAIAQGEKTGDLKGLLEGLRLTTQQLLQTLAKFGVSSIPSAGQAFDPTFHEAMMVVESDLHEPNQVVDELQRGYLLQNRLLRPASVSVSRLPEKKAN
jgi:molecular chaperone GrpE